MTSAEAKAFARALLFNGLFYAWTALCATLALPLLVAPRPVAVGVARLWSRTTVWLLATVVGLRHQVRGRENIPRQAAIFAVKHQSAWETVALLRLVSDPVYVLKRELIAIPIFGWHLARLGMIGVDRAAGAPALNALVRRAREALDRGRHVIIFPEGTRVAAGSHRAYHPGVAALYTMLKVPVVPVALNSGLFWGRRSFMKRAGTITVAFLPAIPPGLKRAKFMAELEARIEGASERLSAEARDAAGRIEISPGQ
jgi:1-acyl-sn-glycerol-3-phosphate acyltransferase